MAYLYIISGFTFCIIGVALLIANVIISVKSKTGKNLPQIICLWFGEIFAVLGIFTIFQTVF